uniref:Uncharacterized protein n=1 Tax=Romanomermis culicivorax TaxID=13658 RepID=A0A915JVE9_ROMCU
MKQILVEDADKCVSFIHPWLAHAVPNVEEATIINANLHICLLIEAKIFQPCIGKEKGKKKGREEKLKKINGSKK